MSHLLVASRAADFLTFALVATLRPIAIRGEANPVEATLYGHGGLWAVLLAQTAITAVLLVLATLWRREGGGRGYVALVASLGFVGAASNIGGLLR